MADTTTTTTTTTTMMGGRSAEEPKSAFSNDGAEAMERGVKVDDSSKVTADDLEAFFELSRCAEALDNHPGTKVALQFPDELLEYSIKVVEELTARTNNKQFFLLADTTFGSCCVDEVAAEHVDADVVVHFGQSCLSRTSRLPALYVFGQYPIDQRALTGYATQLAEEDTSPLHVIFDTRYQHCQDAVAQALAPHAHADVARVDAAFSASAPAPPIPHAVRDAQQQQQHTGTEAGEGQSAAQDQDVGTSSPKDEAQRQSQTHPPPRFGRYAPEFTCDVAEGHRFLFVGAPSARVLLNHMLYFSKSTFHTFAPATNQGRRETARVNKHLMKRYFLIQKAKDAGTVGLVVGTLGSADYRGITDRLQVMLRACGKKDYTLLVGKINPAKLANFDEIDMYCLVACPEYSLIDSSEFYRPVVTPFELELACAPDREWGGFVESDYRQLLTSIDEDLSAMMAAEGDDDEREPHFSLITNSYVDHSDRKQELVRTDKGEIVVREDNTALAEYGGGFLKTRTYQGLEQQLGETPVTKAVQGRTGVPIQYDKEPDTAAPSASQQSKR